MMGGGGPKIQASEAFPFSLPAEREEQAARETLQQKCIPHSQSSKSLFSGKGAREVPPLSSLQHMALQQRNP